MLDLTPLERALASLEEAMDRAADAPDDDLIRDGCIQRFEFCYELSWKMLRRHLAMTVPDASAIDGLSFRDLVRMGCKNGLIDEEVEQWLIYRTARGTTSHTYDKKKAAEVFAVIPEFLASALSLLAALKRAWA